MKNRKGLFNFTREFDEQGQPQLQVIYKLYETEVLRIDNNGFKLDSGGWLTMHTKNCMNDNLPSGYKVFQKRGEWFLTTPDEVLDFEDNMIVITNPENVLTYTKK